MYGDDYRPGPSVRDDYTPENRVEEVQYAGSVPGPENRRMIVYLPKEYDSSEERYPVIYLLHGARGYETSWIRKGRVYQTTDSLWREGKAEKCIVVMPNVNQYCDQKDYDGGRFKNAFESIFEVNGVVESAFVNDVVHTVDSLYRTIPDRKHRAVAGLSIGGYQTIYLGANHPEIFGYIGVMSPYMWALSRPNNYRRDFYGHLSAKMTEQFEAYPPEGFYLYAGEKDIMRPATLKLHKKMEKRGFPHTYTEYPGKHDWPDGWIDEYCDMLQRIFKPEQPEQNLQP